MHMCKMEQLKHNYLLFFIISKLYVKHLADGTKIDCLQLSRALCPSFSKRITIMLNFLKYIVNELNCNRVAIRELTRARARRKYIARPAY